MLSSTDIKWNSINKNQMKQFLKSINPLVEIVTTDTRKSNKYNNDTYLPRGCLSAIWGKQTNIVKYDSMFSDSKRRWIAFKMEANKKIVLVIMLYRLLATTSNGTNIVKVQLDRINKTKSTITHRRELL